MNFLNTFFCSLILIAFPFAVKANLVLTIDAEAETMEWRTGETNYDGSELTFRWGLTGGAGTGGPLIDFTEPAPILTGDYEDNNVGFMRIYTSGDGTEIVGIQLSINASVFEDGGLTESSSGPVTPVFNSGSDFAKFGVVETGTYILDVQESGWEAPIQIEYIAPPASYEDVEIKLEYTGSISFLTRSAFQGLSSAVGGFSLATSYVEENGKMTYTFSANGEYDPNFISNLESAMGNIFSYPYASSTTLEVIKGTPYNGDRLLFTPADTTGVITNPGFLRVAAGNDIFVTIPAEQTNVEPDARILATIDFESWEEITVSGYKNPVGVFFLNDRFFVPAMAADGTTPFLLTSTNGTVWTPLSVPFLPSSMVYGDRVYVGIGAGGAIRSSDGTTWESNIGSGVLPGALRLAYTEGQYVATGGGIYPNGVWISENGLDWTAANPDAIPGRVTAGPFVAGFGGEFVNYHAGANPAPSSGTAFDTANGKLFNFALSGSSVSIYYSDEGIDNFLQADTDPALGFNGPANVAYANGLYAVTGPLMGIYVAEAQENPLAPWSNNNTVGWVYNPSESWIYFVEIDNGVWVWVPDGSISEAFFAYSQKTNDWLYFSSDLDLYYDYSAGLWKDLPGR